MFRNCSNINFQINPHFYSKDPLTSELGKNIINSSIDVLYNIGFEKFNFKLVSQKIGTSESSIYRYFKNKQMLLLYLSDWYWSWKEYQILMQTQYMNSPKDKLIKAIEVITTTSKGDHAFEFIDEYQLYCIMISDFFKLFLVSSIDEQNQKGYFNVYKRIHHRISLLIEESDNEYKYPKSLASTIIEGSLHSQYFNRHLKSMTDISNQKNNHVYYQDLVLKILNFN